MSTQKSVSIFPVLLVNFIGMLGYSIIIPLLVFIVEKFGGNAFVYGLLGAIYPAFQFIGAPILGKWSDRIGRRRVLLISQGGTFLAWALFILSLLLPRTDLFNIDSEFTGAFALSIPLLMLFIARALDGLTGGNVSVANAYLADISKEEDRKGNFGKMASSTSLGFIIGPVIAGLLGATFLEELLPVILAAVISLIAMVAIYFYLPESRPELVDPDSNTLPVSKMFQIEHKECYEMKSCPDSANFRTIWKVPGIPLLFLIYFLTFLGFSFFYAGFPIYASATLGWSPGELGLFFTLSSLVMVVVQGPVLSRLSKKVSDRSLVMVGSLLIGFGFGLFSIADDGVVYLANIFYAIGNGLMWPSFLSILSGTGSKKIQGAIQGYANSMGSLASIMGLLVGGLLYGQIGTLIFYIGGSILILIFFISFRMPSQGTPPLVTSD